MGWGGGWEEMIAHSLLHFSKFSLLCWGLSSKDILLWLLEKVIYGGLSLTSSLSGRVGVSSAFCRTFADLPLTWYPISSGTRR